MVVHTRSGGHHPALIQRKLLPPTCLAGDSAHTLVVVRTLSAVTIWSRDPCPKFQVDSITLTFVLLHTGCQASTRHTCALLRIVLSCWIRSLSR